MILSLSYFVLALCTLFTPSWGRFTEYERIQYWRQHHTWPPNWQPERPGYKALMEQREREIMQIPASDERWENWMQYISGRLVPSFTPNGFLLAQVPADVSQKLINAVNKALERWDELPYEHEVDAIYSDPDKLPKFIHLGALTQEVHQAMLPLHEEWAGGIKLRPTSAYGVRMYQNSSSLVMHYDKTHTHVISSIVHIAHSYFNDSEPWPIEIEDLDGNLHSITLEPGQVS